MACVLTSSNGQWLEANRSFYKHFGQPEINENPKRLDEILSPASRIFFNTHVYPMLFSQGHVDSIACYIQRQGGDKLAVYISGQVQANAKSGQCIWLIFGGSERQHFESALIEARRQAEAQAAELRDVNAQLEGLQAQLIAEMEKTAAANRTLVDLALQDSLTSLGNRRVLDLSEERRRSADCPGQRFGVLLIDIDHFKDINDRYGHARGDDVLRDLADCLRSIARKEDRGIRYGGEEFILLLADTDLEGAQNVAARLHSRIHDIRPGGLPITVSIGIALAQSATETLQATIMRADTALYAAKRAGRNQTIAA